MNAIGLSDWHEGNLRRLAAYLRGPLRARFDMGTFAAEGWDNAEAYKCGSVGCAIGHGPHAGIPKVRGVTWETYSVNVFGLEYVSKMWNWCFSCEWDTYDNTPDGAASRIEWLLDGKPIDFDRKAAISIYFGYRSAPSPKPVPFEVVVLRPTHAEPLEVA